MRLNLGAGGQCPPDWLNVDRAGDVECIHDLREPFWFCQDMAEGAVLHHVLDLLDFEDADPLLCEIRRVLKPGAVLRISGANISRAIREAMRGNREWFDGLVPDTTLMIDTLGEYVLQRGARKTYWSPHLLTGALRTAGYTRTAITGFKMTTGPDWMTDLDSREHESWFVEGTK